MTETLLRRSWRRAWQDLGRAPPAGLFERLLAGYREPQRRYHTVQHLSECIQRLEPALPLARRPGEVEVALWFHDAVYALDRHDNEELSAQWAGQALWQAGAASEPAQRVHAMVMATRHVHDPALPLSPDTQLLLDVDLGILGAEDARFDQYEEQVRHEYAEVPDQTFYPRRRALLQGFLARPRLYMTDHFHDLLEPRARANLARSVARIGSSSGTSAL